jgi:hypothetical protein
MTYDHMVKVNGKWYGAGDEVIETSLPASVTVKTVEPKPDTKEVVEEVKKPETTVKRSNNKGNKK